MKINKTKIVIVSVTLLMLATGVFAQKIKYNFLQGTNFSQYKTYKWVRVEGAEYPNQLLDEQLMRSIDRQLGLKGLSKIDTGTPDLAVVYQVAINQEKQWHSYSTGGDMWGWGGWGGYRGGWGGYGGGYGGGGMTTGTTSTITVGTLNLDMYDIQTKKQIWRGEATKTLDPPKDPKKLQERIDKIMGKLLKNYPPKVKN